MPNPILVCRIAWMHDYTGPAKMFSGASWIREKGSGHEIYNFLRGGPKRYGFVQFAGSMKIERLNGSAEDESISPVDVVWTAPRKGGGVFVVGWYRNATVFRHMQRDPNDARRTSDDGGSLCWWSIRARPRDVKLVQRDDRWFRVTGALVSQSFISYLDGGTAREERLKADLRALITGRLKPPSAPSRRKKQLDFEKRVRVEQAACAQVRRHYESKRFRVTSVEKDRVGWDLEATTGSLTLKLEVKGCSGHVVTAELTPNEYKQSNAPRHRNEYRICIVTNALSKPLLHVFVWNETRAAWEDEKGRALAVEERTGALLHL